MISNIVGEGWSDRRFSAFDSPSHSTLALLFGLCGLYLAWRIWAFTIWPKTHPNQPEVLPYWIPFLGHAVSFFNDADSIITYGRRYFRNARKPFTITVAGERLYVITSASDLPQVYKSIEQLTFDDYITDIMVSFSASPQAVKRIWEPPSPDIKRSGSGERVLVHMLQGAARQQLQPGPQLDKLQGNFLSSVHRSMSWEGMSPKVILSPTQEGVRTISLLQWTREVLLEGATTSFFGPALLRVEPDLFQNFFSFDDKSWKLAYKIPPPWANDMIAAKLTAQNALTRYLDVPKEQRPGACWLVENLEKELRAAGMESSDIAAYLMMYYWVINANAYKVAFWMLSYLIYDPSLLARVRNEISPLINSNPTQSPNELANSFDSTTTPQLMAVYHEVIRVVTSSISVRNVAKPIYIGGKELQPGGRVIVPYRQMLLDDEVFGGDSFEFNPNRFLENKNLSKSSSYRPFGGGSTYCPGRFLAKAEILTCVALAIHKFDMRLNHDKHQGVRGGFPQLELNKPCLGIMSPKEGHDLVFDICQRI